MTKGERFHMFAKFLLGRLSVRDDVRAALQRTPLDLIARHAVCDFGTASSRRVKQNLLALEEAVSVAGREPPLHGEGTRAHSRAHANQEG